MERTFQEDVLRVISDVGPRALFPNAVPVPIWAVVAKQVRSVPSPKSRLSRRGPGPHNGGISFVRGTPPRLTGLELPCVQRTPQATGGRPPAGPTQRSQPSGHPINSIWAGY